MPERPNDSGDQFLSEAFQKLAYSLCSSLAREIVDACREMAAETGSVPYDDLAERVFGYYPLCLRDAIDFEDAREELIGFRLLFDPEDPAPRPFP